MGVDEGLEFAFVAANGPRIGLGHLRRCLTLATELADHGKIVFLVSGDAAGVSLVRDTGFAAAAVERPDVGRELRQRKVSLAIVDDYAFVAEELSRLRGIVPLVVIDDLGDRALVCDAILNAGAAAEQLPYVEQTDCVRLLGPRYALVSRAYRDAPLREIATVVRRVLITLGGADPEGDTTFAIAAVRQALPAAQIDVVVGPFFDESAVACLDSSVRFHRGLHNLAPLMISADLAVTAGGQTTYELAACGLPAVALCIAANQRPNVDALVRLGVVVEGVRRDAGRLAAIIATLAADVGARTRMRGAARALVDGQGAIRAAAALASLARERKAHHA